MKFKDIPEYSRTEYKKICTCGDEFLILTQHDKPPEPDYWTNVYLKCPCCGDYVEFELPVN